MATPIFLLALGKRNHGKGLTLHPLSVLLKIASASSAAEGATNGNHPLTTQAEAFSSATFAGVGVALAQAEIVGRALREAQQRQRDHDEEARTLALAADADDGGEKAAVVAATEPPAGPATSAEEASHDNNNSNSGDNNAPHNESIDALRVAAETPIFVDNACDAAAAGTDAIATAVVDTLAPMSISECPPPQRQATAEAIATGAEATGEEEVAEKAAEDDGDYFLVEAVAVEPASANISAPRSSSTSDDGDNDDASPSSPSSSSSSALAAEAAANNNDECANDDDDAADGHHYYDEDGNGEYIGDDGGSDDAFNDAEDEEEEKDGVAFDYHPADEASTDPEAYLHLRLRRGEIIGGGRYRVLKRLGEGQSSRVWLAERLDSSSAAASPAGEEEEEKGDTPAATTPLCLCAVKVCKRGSLYRDAVDYERLTIEYLNGGGEKSKQRKKSKKNHNDGSGEEDEEGCGYSSDNSSSSSDSDSDFLGATLHHGSGQIARLLDAFGQPANVPMLDEDGEEIPIGDSVYDDPTETTHPCLVFPCLGAPLDSLISLTQCNGLNPRAVRELVRNILKIAVHLSERQIIHTDLKPENLLLCHPKALSDPAVSAALQPTVRFTVTPTATPPQRAVATPPRNSIGNSPALLSLEEGNGAAAQHNNTNTANGGAADGGGEEPTFCLNDVASVGGSSSRLSISMAGGGDGPLVPAMADGSSALDLALIDFGLSYFEPAEYKPMGQLIGGNKKGKAGKKKKNANGSSASASISSPSDEDGGLAAPSPAYTPSQAILADQCNYQLGVEIQTREYRAPEILLGKPFNTRTDLWSVGCIAYELITGRYLFDPKVSDELRELKRETEEEEDNSNNGDEDGYDDDDNDDDPDALKYTEDVEHLKLITHTIGPKPFNRPDCPTAAERGTYEDDFYYPDDAEDVDGEICGGDHPIPRFDPTITVVAQSSLMTLPSSVPSSSSSSEQRLRNLDEEVRPFLGPLESALFVSFLMKCLKWNPNDRPSAEELLQHPWLTKN